MTRGEFEELVIAYCDTEAQPYIATRPTAASELGAFCSDAIREFTGWSYCLFQNEVALTVPASAVVALVGAHLAKEVICPVAVYLNSVPLRNYEDQIAPCRLNEVTVGRVTGSGTPTRWAFRPPEQILFNQTAGSIAGSSWVNGFIRHPVLASDSAVVELKEEFIRPAVLWAVAKLMEPRAGGTSLDKMTTLDARAKEFMVYSARLAMAEFPYARPPILSEVREA